MGKVKAAIIGSGNIGTDLMIKIVKRSERVELVAMVGIDPDSEGLARARALGIPTTHEGIEGLRAMPGYRDIAMVFDATSAYAHRQHDEILRRDGKRVIDLTPAAIGPFTVPVVNMDAHLDAPNVNLVTCGGQTYSKVLEMAFQAARHMNRQGAIHKKKSHGRRLPEKT